MWYKKLAYDLNKEFEKSKNVKPLTSTVPFFNVSNLTKTVQERGLAGNNLGNNLPQDIQEAQNLYQQKRILEDSMPQQQQQQVTQEPNLQNQIQTMNFINSSYAAQAITNLAKSLGTNVSDAANRANQQGYKINGKYLLQDPEFVSWVRQSFVPEQTQYNQTGNQQNAQNTNSMQPT